MTELFDLESLLADGPRGNKLTCGIHTGVSVKSISRKETPKGNTFIEILFEKDGATVQKTLWEPKGTYPEDGETPEAAKARETRLNLTHIAKLLGLYLTPEQKASFPNLDYNSFIDKAIATLTPLLPTKKVNLKVIYDSEGVFTELGRYPDYVELFQEGVEPTIAFTPYEIQKRTTAKEKPSAKKKNDLEDLLSNDSPV